MAEYKRVIVEAKRRLTNPDLRFNENAVVHMRSACGTAFGPPDFSEQIASDYGVSEPGNDAVKAQFWEEIKALEESIDHCGIRVRPAGWQRIKSGAADTMYRSLNRRAYAMQLWDSYAIPIRWCDGHAIAIWAPQDAMGTPTVHSYDPAFVLARLATRLAQEQGENLRVERKWRRTIQGAGVLLVVGVVISYVLLR